MAMMRILEAEQKWRSVSRADAWMRRVRNEQGRYVYEAGIGVKTFASEAFSAEQCYAMASLNYDQYCRIKACDVRSGITE